MSEATMAAIRSEIEEHGSIGFDRFMELALYGPGGFYEQPPVGERGHFVTSPHVHPVFASLLGVAIEDLWRSLGSPRPLRLVELGAGDGMLAEQLLERLRERLAPTEVAYTAVERSSGSRRALGRLPIDVLDDLADIEPGGPTLIVANELLDNLPFHRVRADREGDLTEIRVGLREGRLVEVDAPCPPEIAAAAPIVRPGEEAAVSLETLALVDRLAPLLQPGHALLIDYGDDSGRPAGPVHAYRDHGIEADVLSDPGSRDITAGVDLGAVAQRARDRGLESHGPVTQAHALRALGFDEWSRGVRARQGELLADGRGMDAVGLWSDRNRAALLLAETGLGSLRWLLLSSPGLPPPGDWLT